MASGNSRKEFIINHMNTDHQDSLSLYLKVYNNVPFKDAAFARLEDISLTDLLITAAGTRYSVPINPPMQDISDTRPRMITMHRECLDRQGLSDIVIAEYPGPQGVEAVAFAFFIVVNILLYRRSNFLPGSVVYDWLFSRSPAVAAYCYNVQPLLFFGMISIHVAEALLLAVRRLRRHQVPFSSVLWWIWIVSTLIEGLGTWRRFDRAVREKQKMR